MHPVLFMDANCSYMHYYHRGTNEFDEHPRLLSNVLSTPSNDLLFLIQSIHTCVIGIAVFRISCVALYSKTKRLPPSVIFFGRGVGWGWSTQICDIFIAAFPIFLSIFNTPLLRGCLSQWCFLVLFCFDACKIIIHAFKWFRQCPNLCMSAVSVCSYIFVFEIYGLKLIAHTLKNCFIII